MTVVYNEMQEGDNRRVGGRGGGGNHQLGTETPQGQSDTGRNPSPPLFPEPLQEHNTKALIPSKIKLPADRILLEGGGSLNLLANLTLWKDALNK